MKKLLATLPLLALLSCTGIPPQRALSHFDWTEPADPQGEKPETWNGVEKPIVTFGSTDVRDTLRSSRDGSNDPHGLARREGLGPGCHLRSRGCRRPDLHRGRLRRGQRREAPRHRPRTLRQIRRQRPLSDRPTLRRTAGEQPGAPRSGPARRGGFMRRARPVDPSRLDHGRHPARRRPRPLHGSGCGKR